MKSLEHLEWEIRDTVDLPLSARIHELRRDRWIGYSRAQQAIDALSDLLMYPRTLRMQNMLLVGESGNGKSTIISHFESLYPSYCRDNGHPEVPVVVMNMPSEPNESRFWSELLLQLMIAHRDTDPVQRKKEQALSVLEYVKCRMLVIDEIHNILYGHARAQRHFLGVLKNLSNALKLPIVAVGTRDAIRALHTDPQISSRFAPFGLARWKLDREFLRLLASFERLLPLAEPSNLTNRETAIKVFNMSEGLIGGVSGVLKAAAVHALREGKERIEPQMLDEIEWVSLKNYGEQARAL
ncbi:TniB family NTP-binding protein [Sediminicurvatus halobius]|uniref:Transposase n=1 Tax=Sediminicurvatus halobius TaxID=2182432 RepID=A0A2U2N9G9_9GAMM|nr:TniB family NTP-binding protein [Spiribacter halobius]PWG65700.1 transposase [Spiribacter halobius]UEX77735.1 TniB family NTP-binding protein [Spiribacter halobius]